MNPRVFIALALALTCNLSFSATLEGCVVRVADGDTVTVELDNGKRERIRFEGIDAPESSQTYGRESRKNLIDLLKNTALASLWNMTEETTMAALSVKSSPEVSISTLNKSSAGLHGFTAIILKTSLWPIKPATLQQKFQPEIAMQDFGLILIRPLRGYTVETTDRFVPFKESNGKALLPTSPLNFYSGSKFWRQSAFSTRVKT